MKTGDKVSVVNGFAAGKPFRTPLPCGAKLEIVGLEASGIRVKLLPVGKEVTLTHSQIKSNCQIIPA